jgi:transposase-like protein
MTVEILKHTNNPLARLMREIRRRTRVFGVFPDGKSALMLIAASQRHVTRVGHEALSADELTG